MKRVPILRNFNYKELPLGFVEYDETRLTDLELLTSVLTVGGVRGLAETTTDIDKMQLSNATFEVLEFSVESDEAYLKYLEREKNEKE